MKSVTIKSASNVIKAKKTQGSFAARKSELKQLTAAYQSEKLAADKLLADIKKKFKDLVKDLESQDKLGNFEIQDLMSNFNQAETLASSVKKKLDDTINAIISKI